MPKRSEKTEFAKALADRLGVSQDEARRALEGVFALVAERLRAEGRVAIWAVGQFEVVDMRVPPQWRTPKAGAVKERRQPKSIRFRPSKVFRDQID
jgi:nucleoid DNA-binding protein